MPYSFLFYIVFFLIMEIAPVWVFQLFNASGEMLSIGVTSLRLLAASYLLSIVALTFSAAFQGLSMGVQSMVLTLGRQVILPVIFIAVLSQFGKLSFIWLALVLAEAAVVPFGSIFWKKSQGKLWRIWSRVNVWLLFIPTPSARL